MATWRNANSGREDGAAELHIDGVLRGWMTGYRHQVTWDIGSMTIGLGQRYSGGIDELLILDASLSQESVTGMFRLPGPVGDMLKG